MVNNETSIHYLISRHFLEVLLVKGLITQREFERIDEENKKSFL
jgi:hypothetical protein